MRYRDAVKPTETYGGGGGQRTLAFDALRVAAILAVLAIHALMTSRGLDLRPGSMAWTDDWLTRFAVPMLAFLSGVLVWGRPWRGGPGAYRTFLRRRFGRVAIPYLAWSALFIALLYAGAPGSNATFAGEYAGSAVSGVGVATLLTRIPGYLLSGHSWYHLYFVPMVLTFYLATPLASRALRAFSGSAEVTVIALLAFKVQAWPVLSPLVQELTGEFVWSWSVHLVQHAPHIALGGWFAVRVLPHAQRWLSGQRWEGGQPARGDGNGEAGAAGTSRDTAAAGLAGIFTPRPIAWSLALKPVYLIATVALVALLLEPQWRRIERPLRALSRLSFGAYFAHPLILLAIQLTVGTTADAGVPGSSAELAWGSWLTVATAFALMTGGAFGIASALERTGRTRWLIGE